VITGNQNGATRAIHLHIGAATSLRGNGRPRVLPFFVLFVCFVVSSSGGQARLVASRRSWHNSGSQGIRRTRADDHEAHEEHEGTGPGGPGQPSPQRHRHLPPQKWLAPILHRWPQFCILPAPKSLLFGVGIARCTFTPRSAGRDRAELV
jgi:hypothetical protein